MVLFCFTTHESINVEMNGEQMVVDLINHASKFVNFN